MLSAIRASAGQTWRGRRPAVVRFIPAVIVAVLAISGPLPGSAAVAAGPTPITPGVAFRVQVADEVGSVEAKYTFTGTAGKRVTLSQTGSIGADGVYYQLSNGTGELAPAVIQTFGDLGVLTSSGTWTLTARNTSEGPTDAQATLGLVSDTTGAVAFGSSTTKALTIPGVNHNLTFSGTAGAKISISITQAQLSGVTPGVAFTLVRPDGSSPDPFGYVTAPDFLSGVLDVSGTWTLRVDPLGDTTGSITFTVTKPVDQVVTVNPGTATKVTFAGNGSDVRLKLAGTAGQRVTLQVVTSALTSQFGHATPPRTQVKLIAPDGTETDLPVEPSAAGYYAQAEATLASSGSWTVLLHAVDDTKGTQTVKIGLVTDQKSALTLGTPMSVKTSTPGQNAAYTFTAKAGQNYIVRVASQSWTAGSAGGDPAQAGARIYLLGPDPQMFEEIISAGGDFGEIGDLHVSGTYTVVVDPRQDSIGSMTFTVAEPKATTAPLAFGKSTTATIARGDVARFTFNGSPGQRGNLRFTSVTYGPSQSTSQARVWLKRPDGSTLWSSAVTLGTFLEPDALDAKGVWTMEIDPEAATTGSFTFVARQVTDQKSALAYGQQITTTITTPGQTARYTFTAKAGDRVAVDTLTQSWSNEAGNTTTDVGVQLVSPSGEITNLGSGTQYPNPDSRSTWAQTDGTITVSGTWTLVIDPVQDYVGSRTFTLRKLATLKAGPITLGTPKTVTIANKGTWVEYTFTHTPDDPSRSYYDFTITGSTISAGNISIDGQYEFFGLGSSTGTLQLNNVPAGTLTLRVKAFPTQTGTGTGTAMVSIKYRSPFSP